MREQKFPTNYGGYEVVRARVDRALVGAGKHSLTFEDLNGLIFYMAIKPGKASPSRLKAFARVLEREPVLVPELMLLMHKAWFPTTKGGHVRKYILTKCFGMLHDDEKWSDCTIASAIKSQARGDGDPRHGVTHEDVRKIRQRIIKEQS